jgi:hypothetical protein
MAAVVVLAGDIHDCLYACIGDVTVAPYVHRQYGHVRPWRKSLGGVSLSPEKKEEEQDVDEVEDV